MSDEVIDQLWKLEEQFWMGDTTVYEEHLDNDSLMVFQEPVGVLGRESIIESIAGTQRWVNVRLEDQHVIN